MNNVVIREHVILYFLAFAILAIAWGCEGNSPREATSRAEVITSATPFGRSAAHPTTPSPSTSSSPIRVSIDGETKALVLARDVVPGLVEDLKYYTSDNFMKRRLYDDPNCYLLSETANQLATAARELNERKPGFRLKVWDCYRPMKVQEAMWAAYTNTPYVANPKTARHPRGRAVDITIVDANGAEVEMPTEYDDFSSKAHPSAKASAAATANRELLRSVMVNAGFTGVNSEWWHFDLLKR